MRGLGTWMAAAVILIAGGADANAARMTLAEGMTAHQVFQARPDGRATLGVSGVWEHAGEGLAYARILHEGVAARDWQEAGRAQDGAWSGTLADVRVGGPYRIEWMIQSVDGRVESLTAVEPVFVGDVWMLAGQSNMQGVGNLDAAEPPHPKVMLFAMNREWRPASDPLHILAESPDSVHFDPAREDRAEVIRTRREHVKGAGLGLPFAREMYERTGRPQGLIAAAHGGTSMDQWNPALRDEGGASLYGSMHASFLAAGGQVRGVLWYQGESDAQPLAHQAFPEKFRALIAAIRRDFGDPDLPFLYVQIGRFVRHGMVPAPWNSVQAAQLEADAAIPRTAMVASVDLPLDDLIHIGTDGLKTLGQRLAKRAERMLYDGSVEPGPRLARITRERTAKGLLVRLEFNGVNGGLRAPGRLSGFSISAGPGGETIPCIFRQEIDPADANAVLLWITDMPEAPHLWHGRGLDPYCNLSDAENMQLPVFGPVEIP